MANRSTDVPDNSNPNASGVEQGLERGQTSNAQTNVDALIAELRELKSETTNLKKQLQSQDDRMAARLKKEQAKNKDALTRTAQLKGWTKEQLQTELDAIDEQPLTFKSLLSETDNLEQGDTPTPTRAVAPQTASAVSSGAVYDEPTQLEQFNTVLADMGLTDADLKAVDGKGIAGFVGKPHTRETINAWTKLTARALEQKEQLAAEVAARKQREGEADEVAEEIEQFGNLGGTLGERGAGGSPSPNQVARLKEQAMKEYRGTGRIADALAARRAIEQRYGS